VRHVIGLIPLGKQGIRIDPLPFGLSASIKRLRVANRMVEVTVRPGTFAVRIEGKAAGRGRVGTPLEVNW
jgi:hypothetical protein